MSVDLSVYVSDLAKTFCTNLRSKHAVVATLAPGKLCIGQNVVSNTSLTVAIWDKIYLEYIAGAVSSGEHILRAEWQ